LILIVAVSDKHKYLGAPCIEYRLRNRAAG
jgi:hypothetical protein